MERTFTIGEATLTLTETDRIDYDNPIKVVVDASLTLSDGTAHDIGPLYVYPWSDRDLLTEAFKATLSFLSAGAEAYAYDNRGMGYGGYGYESENWNMFVPVVMEWAYLNSDEIEMLSFDSESEGAFS